MDHLDLLRQTGLDIGWTYHFDWYLDAIRPLTTLIILQFEDLSLTASTNSRNGAVVILIVSCVNTHWIGGQWDTVKEDRRIVPCEEGHHPVKTFHSPPTTETTKRA